ncbi:MULTISPECIES: flagellar hook-basal body complex protein FliE [Massilia]|uniref:Flagellar hook-basal body complex protein FliE n=1 Tax=Massilia aurea TaxID=373040 RepID=A0A422QMH7_9BURK|nr:MULTISPECIES: flagellar hook-basal body complex protein FliE [Massilia]MDY0965590.1 flagellar hook-basal body complex protein FliE [Massilia sp. CFBP9026]RNF31197.1 flagellar hook-basal body complex protein FliE [Massilia aurea]
MATELAGLIRADLAQLTNDANRLAIAPAANSFAELGAHGAHGAQADAGFSFTHVMKQALDNVNAQDQAAGARVAAVEAGKSDDLVGAMLASQQASLSFSMLMQVRNKVMTAVDELIKLPV